MDLACPTCGEPWDFDCLHEEAQERYGIPYYEEPDAQGYHYGSPYFTKVKNDKYNANDYQRFYEQVSAEFRIKGCKALTHLTDADYCKPQPRDPKSDKLTEAEAASVLYDLLGDDMDGAAAMLDDFRMGY